MKKKLTLNKVLGINDTLKRLIDNDGLKINLSLKFKLLGIMKSLELPVANFEYINNEKIREYGKEQEDGKIIISPEDDLNHLKNTQRISMNCLLLKWRLKQLNQGKFLTKTYLRKH